VTDPTQFHDRHGIHDAGAQAAWYLTLERMLADATLMQSEPGGADIARIQLAFDILDKSEGLLGYADSGPGFKDLLKRSKTLPRLNDAWKTLPASLQDRFRAHSQLVFDTLYDDIRAHAVNHRKTKNGMLVADDDPAKPTPVSMDAYVGLIVRAVRNSGHGLKRLLREPDRHLIATHSGDMPLQLTDLTALIVLALVADANKLCGGQWW
jgi:hypothetical protein